MARVIFVIAVTILVVSILTSVVHALVLGDRNSQDEKSTIENIKFSRNKRQTIGDEEYDPTMFNNNNNCSINKFLRNMGIQNVTNLANRLRKAALNSTIRFRNAATNTTIILRAVAVNNTRRLLERINNQTQKMFNVSLNVPPKNAGAVTSFSGTVLDPGTLKDRQIDVALKPMQIDEILKSVGARQTSNYSAASVSSASSSSTAVSGGYAGGRSYGRVLTYVFTSNMPGSKN